MISQGLRKRRYGGDPSVIGRTIAVNRVPHVVVGIATDVGFASDVDLGFWGTHVDERTAATAGSPCLADWLRA